MQNDNSMVTVYIGVGALMYGIREMRGTVDADGCFHPKEVKILQEFVESDFPSYQHFRPGYWHRDRNKAVADAERERLNEIRKLKIQLQSLEENPYT